MNCTDQTTRLSLVQNLQRSKEIPVSVGARLLNINRSSVYVSKKQVSTEELTHKRIIDQLHTDHPTWGNRQMVSQLKRQGYLIGRKRVRRYMTEMGIEAIYPKENLSRRAHATHIMPYLLRNMVINRPNQVWSIDITYIPTQFGHVYMTAIIDWYSKCIVGWYIDDSLGVYMVIQALERALRHAKPDIINSDQGSQFTSKEYREYLKSEGIKQSMDGKGRWADNIAIERWFRTFKHDEAYINEYRNIKDTRRSVAAYIDVYNTKRHHSALGMLTPVEVYSLSYSN